MTLTRIRFWVAAASLGCLSFLIGSTCYAKTDINFIQSKEIVTKFGEIFSLNIYWSHQSFIKLPAWCGLEVNWGDGLTSEIHLSGRSEKSSPLEATHYYANPGEYTVRVKGLRISKIRDFKLAPACNVPDPFVSTTVTILKSTAEDQQKKKESVANISSVKSEEDTLAPRVITRYFRDIARYLDSTRVANRMPAPPHLLLGLRRDDVNAMNDLDSLVNAFDDTEDAKKNETSELESTGSSNLIPELEEAYDNVAECRDLEAVESLRTYVHNPQARFLIGLIFWHGKVVNKDLEHSLIWIRDSASNVERTDAMYYMGLAHEFGLSVYKDFTASSDWYLASGSRGFAPANYRLGLAYIHGKGVKKDLAKALELVTAAAEKGYLPAMTKLSTAYKTGENSTPIDLEKSFQWHQRASAARNPACDLFADVN